MFLLKELTSKKKQLPWGPWTAKELGGSGLSPSTHPWQRGQKPSLIPDDSVPKNSSLTKLQKYFVSSQPLVHQEALDVLNVVRHLDDHLIGNRAHHLTRGRAAHGDDGSVESVIDREVKPTAIAL